MKTQTRKTLRDEYAMIALTGLLSRALIQEFVNPTIEGRWFKNQVENAFLLADIAMQQRKESTAINRTKRRK